MANEIDGGKVPIGHRITIMGNLFVCDACFDTLGFKRFASLADLPIEQIIQVQDGRLEAFEAAYNAIEGRRIFCLSCLEDLGRQGRRLP